MQQAASNIAPLPHTQLFLTGRSFYLIYIMQHNGYYALRTVGIFKEWREVEEAIKGMPNPQFRSFRTLSAADAYMNGWEDSTNSSSNPFGFAGPSSLPPVPTERLGREHVTTPSTKSKSSRSRMRHRPASSLASAHSTSAAGPSPSNAANSAFVQPSSSSLTPPPSLTVETGPRRRSPLIQSVLEEEEESTSDPEQPPTPDSSDVGHRSRSDSVVSGHSVGQTIQWSAGSSRKKSTLKIGSMFSPIRPITPPSSPEPSGSDARGSTSFDGRPPGITSWPNTLLIEDKPVNKSRFSFKRLSSVTTSTVIPSPPAVPPKPVAPLGKAVPTHAPARPRPASIWAVEPLERPRQQPSLASLQSSNQSSDSILMDPLSPFACSAPTFSRSSSAASSVVLPCRSPSSSTTSLHRPRSIQSLHHARSSSSLFSAKSGTSEAKQSGLRSVEPQPTLKSLCSYNSLSLETASIDSFSDALTHISGESADGHTPSSDNKPGISSGQVDKKSPETKGKGWKKAFSGFKRAVAVARA
ncbi:Ribosomal protein L9/RNase H1, N-terminal [Phaffia rhodozyma]|uniref:Ribosomal protein L9/RNase H1, N-terminal n=1 Tax=Phaffia rhodozyma TaxID=264483 RepID=A0A0F7SS67_PHARH|nr:Ribosomal protein L9/RNase H1, N-terminal [Phaffia rhodozyma]